MLSRHQIFRGAQININRHVVCDAENPETNISSANYCFLRKNSAYIKAAKFRVLSTFSGIFERQLRKNTLILVDKRRRSARALNFVPAFIVCNLQHVFGLRNTRVRNRCLLYRRIRRPPLAATRRSACSFKCLSPAEKSALTKIAVSTLKQEPTPTIVYIHSPKQRLIYECATTNIVFSG